MKLTDLLDEFNVVIDTAEGLTELRSLILGLAVRGKLVPQDPNDEPASELLKKIEAEKERLYKEGEISKPKSLKDIKSDEYLFEIPENWIWTKLGKLTSFNLGRTPKSKNPKYWDGDYTWISIGDMPERGSISVSDRKITDAAIEEVFRGGDPVPVGSLLMSFKLSIGKVAIADVPLFHNEAIISFDYLVEGLKQYLYWNLGFLSNEGKSKKAIKGNTLNTTSLNNLAIPLPPLAEQNRIVQRIESLFAEVDELEAKLNRQIQLDEKLQLAINAEVQQASDAEASKSAWNFITSNFDTLYHTPDAIDNLKKNILNEAVRGRLVPQNPNDEPAFELLKKIESEKQRLYEAGEIRKPKKFPVVKKEEVSFEIPEEWVWCRWRELLSARKYSMKRGPFGSSLRKADFVKSGIRVFEQYNPINDDPHWVRYYITDEKYQSLKAFTAGEGDLLISCSGATLGKITKLPKGVESGIINQALLKLNLDQKVILNDYFIMLFRSNIIQNNIWQKALGSAIPNMVGVNELKAMPIPLPPIKEQHRIVQRIEELFAICDRFKAQLEQRQAVNERLVKGLVGEVLEGE